MGKHTKFGKFKGNHTLSAGWQSLCDFVDTNGVTWVVYAKKTDPLGRYLGIKIAARGLVDRKANYWMAWDCYNDKLFRQHAGELTVNRPDVFKLATQYLKLFA